VWERKKGESEIETKTSEEIERKKCRECEGMERERENRERKIESREKE